MSDSATAPAVHWRGRSIWFGRVVAVACVMGFASIIAGHGVSAAPPVEVAGPKAATPSDRDGTTSSTGPITLAGRWTGPHYGYARVNPKASACAGKKCTVTYDIVACDTGWCGIAVSDEKTCGAVALRIAPDTRKNHENAFTGKLELVKGAAPYVIEGWYAAPDADQKAEAAGKPRLSLVGDTGTELLMMRRSFPFQAELTRISDAQCSLQHTIS